MKERWILAQRTLWEFAGEGSAERGAQESLRSPLRAPRSSERSERLDEAGPAPAQRHSETSVAAAASVEAGNVRGRDRQRLLRLLVQYGPATDEEMAHRLGMSPNTQRPRRVELCRLGVVVDTGHRRRTVAGRKATVWGLKTAAVALGGASK
jgi:hypothetical protein